MTLRIITVLIIVTIFNYVYALKILQIVPGFTNSHVLFNYRLSETLTGLGHQVALWTQMEMNMVFVGDVKRPENVTEIRVPIHFKDKLKTEGLKVFQEMMFNKGSAYDLWWTGQEFKSMRIEACQQMLYIDYETKSHLRNERFDLVIAHFHDLCPIALAEKIGIRRIIWVTHGTSLYDYTALQMGLGLFPSFVPHPLSSFGDRMNFAQRTINVLWHLSTIDFINLPQNLLTEENEMYKNEYCKNGDPDLWTLSRTVNVLLINGERFLDFPRPLPYGISFMGEVGDRKADPKMSCLQLENITAYNIGSKEMKIHCAHSSLSHLPLEIQKIYERAKTGYSKGVVIFSLGTVSNTANMPSHMVDAFVHAFASIPNVDFIWKMDVVVPNIKNYKNIHTFGWIPQKDLITHACTRLLLAHGGYNSFFEASQAGIPIVLMPLFADQFINVQRARRFGIAQVLNKLALTSQSIANAINNVLNDTKYLINARRLSAMLIEKPPIRVEFRAGETEAETKRHLVLKYGLKLAISKRPKLFALKAAQKLSRLELNLMDVFFTFLIVIISLICLIYSK